MTAPGDRRAAAGELVARAQAGSGTAFAELVRRHQRMIESEAARFFLPGAGPDDVAQEALIGFFKAVCAYRAASGAFEAFARLCVRRQIRSAVTAARRHKHAPLNEAARLEYVADEGALTLDDPKAEPAATLIARERLALLRSAAGQLTELERIALGHALLGWSTGETARRVERPRKTMDNALQRARRKLEALEQQRAAGAKRPPAARLAVPPGRGRRPPPSPPGARRREHRSKRYGVIRSVSMSITTRQWSLGPHSSGLLRARVLMASASAREANTKSSWRVALAGVCRL